MKKRWHSPAQAQNKASWGGSDSLTSRFSPGRSARPWREKVLRSLERTLEDFAREKGEEKRKKEER